MLSGIVCMVPETFFKSKQQPCCTCSGAAWNAAGLHLVLICGLFRLPPRQAQLGPLTTSHCLELTAANFAQVALNDEVKTIYYAYGNNNVKGGVYERTQARGA